MLIASSASGKPVEATRDLPDGSFTCPACTGPVLLKRGRVKVPHFAHLPEAECWTEPESANHLLSKQVLAERFRTLGYEVTLEEISQARDRRIDVAVTVPTKGRQCRVAIEVQDSAISVEEMKARTRIDKSLGFIGTTWVFTDKRADALLSVAYSSDVERIPEVRVPKEMLWVDNRYQQGIFVLDPHEERVWNIQLASPDLRGSDWYDEYGNEQSSEYRPRTLRRPVKREASFTLACRPGRYREWAIVFLANATDAAGETP